MHKVIRQMSQLRVQSQLSGAALLKPANTCSPHLSQSPPALPKSIHTAAGAAGGTLCTKWNKHNYGPRKWLEYNKTVHPPQEPEEEPRKAVRKNQNKQNLLEGNSPIQNCISCLEDEVLC